MADGPRVFATAADERYGYHLLNLVGSLKANSDVFDHVVAFDLGLSGHQRALIEHVPAVEVRDVPPFSPHWSQGYAWKPWAWTHVAPDGIVLWLDAGATVLRSLEPVLARIRERGYFVVSQGNRLADIVPSDYWALYGVPPSLGAREYVAAGILGFEVGGDFYRRVVVPTWEDCLAGRSLGFSAQEATALNRGLLATDSPIIRDCRHFRHDQTVLNLRLFSAYPDPVVADLSRYGGWRSPRDHPEQVIWNHRRGGSMAYLARVPYAGRGRFRARLFGVAFRIRWWKKLHGKYFTTATYVWKARKIARSLHRGRA